MIIVAIGLLPNKPSQWMRERELLLIPFSAIHLAIAQHQRLLIDNLFTIFKKKKCIVKHYKTKKEASLKVKIGRGSNCYQKTKYLIPFFFVVFERNWLSAWLIVEFNFACVPFDRIRIYICSLTLMMSPFELPIGKCHCQVHVTVGLSTNGCKWSETWSESQRASSVQFSRVQFIKVGNKQQMSIIEYDTDR